jgi:hypothetical protein
MRKGEALIEIKILISRKSFFDFINEKDFGQSPPGADAIYAFLSKRFDVKKLEFRSASISRSTPHLYVNVAGNAAIITKKGWD